MARFFFQMAFFAARGIETVCFLVQAHEWGDKPMIAMSCEEIGMTLAYLLLGIMCGVPLVINLTEYAIATE